MTPPSSLIHDRPSVQALLQAYADKSESFFTGLKQIPGDPCGVVLRRFGATRTCIARGHDWLNRATLTGDENFEVIGEIMAHFNAHHQRCHIEWNPGNCHRAGTWNSELGVGLLARGFQPGSFRCVWHAPVPLDIPPHASAVQLRHFGPDDKEEFLAALLAMEKKTAAEQEEMQAKFLFGQRSAQWHHYVGYLDGQPCCTATMFENGHTAYLDWGYTLESFRRRGCHGALVRQRMLDAHQAGCTLAASVTDIGLNSASTLQGVGFRLAYNYVMLIRDPRS